MKTNKTFFQGFFSKISWYSGLLSGILFSSFIVWGTPLVLPHIFSSGSPISSSEVNANFDAIKNKMNENDYTLVVKMSADINIPISSPGVELQLDSVLKDSLTPGAYDGTSRVTIPTGEQGLFSVYIQTQIDTGCMGRDIYIEIDGVEHYLLNLCSGSVQSTSKKFIINTGNIVRFIAKENMDGAYTISSAETLVILKRDARL